VITRDRWKEIPLNNAIIEKLNKIAISEKNFITSENLQFSLNSESGIMSDNILDNADDKTQQKLISNADNLREVPTSDNGITSTLLEEKIKDGTIKNNNQFIASDHIVSDFMINNSTIGDIMEKDVATSIGSNDENAIDSSNLIENDHHISQNIDLNINYQ
jgi:hypothetical protein